MAKNKQPVKLTPYEEGWNAGASDGSVNPYKEGTESAKQWQQGYDDFWWSEPEPSLY